MNRNSVIDWSLILAIGVAWGASFLFIKVAAPEVGPITLVFSRLLIASLILTPIFVRFDNLKNLERKNGFSEKQDRSVNFFNQGEVNEWSQILPKEISFKIEEKFAREMTELNYKK